MPILEMISRGIIDGFRSKADDPRSITDDSRSIIDDSRLVLQLMASFMILICDCHIFIVQATG